MQCDAADTESIELDVKLPIFIRMMNPRRDPIHNLIDATANTYTAQAAIINRGWTFDQVVVGLKHVFVATDAQYHFLS